MDMRAETFLGTPLQSQKIVPGNTATGIATSVIVYTEYTIPYDSGDYAFVAGDVIVGASSGAVGIVVSCTVATGTVAGGDAAGLIRFKSWNGVNFTNNEKIKIGADADVGDIDGTAPTAITTDYQFKGRTARHLLLSAKAQTAALAIDGSTPDQTYLLSHDIPAGGSYVLNDIKEMYQAKVIDKASGSASTVIVTAYFRG
jgi:hypothetical protein